MTAVASAYCSHLGWSSWPLRIAFIPSTTWDGALRLLRSPTYDGVVLLRIALISSTTWDGAFLHALLTSSPRRET